MKQYGSKFSTEFTKKQIGVLYYKAKDGVYNVEKWFMAELYNAADYYGYDDNRSMATFESCVKTILDLMFEGKEEECQSAIDTLTEKTFNQYSTKISKKFDRNMVA